MATKPAKRSHKLHWSRHGKSALRVKLGQLTTIEFRLRSKKWRGKFLQTSKKIDSAQLKQEVLMPLESILNGRLILHGALLKKERRGILIFASSGTGKSTLTGYLMQNGWEALSDDMSEIIFKGSQVVGKGVRKSLSLDKKSLALLNLGGFSGGGKQTRKLTSPTKVVPMSSIVLLKTGKRFRARQVSAIEAMAILLKGSWRPPLELDSSFPRYVSQVAKLVEKIPCEVVEYPKQKASLQRMQTYLARI